MLELIWLYFFRTTFKLLLPASKQALHLQKRWCLINSFSLNSVLHFLQRVWTVHIYFTFSCHLNNIWCPTRYRTRHFFNNRLAGGRLLLRVASIRCTTDTFLFISYTTNVFLFKFRIIKEMPGSGASGTPYTMWREINSRFTDISLCAKLTFHKHL